MATLLSLGPQAFAPTTIGPTQYSFAGYKAAMLQITPTIWPASGDVATVTFTFGSGKGGIVTFQGGAYPRAGIHGQTDAGPWMSVGVPPGETQVTVTIQILQAFTASVLVTAD